jgi:CheY-like chemotaxis protein
VDETGLRRRPLALVADDDESIRLLVEALLTAEGFLCATVGDGERLLRVLDAIRPAVVVLDMRMPRLDGFGILDHIRATPALGTVPVVAFSAEVSPERVPAAGCRFFLRKPFDLDELLTTVQCAVGASPRRDRP